MSHEYAKVKNQKENLVVGQLLYGITKLLLRLVLPSIKNTNSGFFMVISQRRKSLAMPEIGYWMDVLEH